MDIPGGIGLAENIDVVSYFAYLDDPNSLPVYQIYRPEKDSNGIHVPNFRLLKNKTLIRKLTFLQMTRPVNFSYFNLTTFYFPFDRYYFLFVLPMMNYSQDYSADIIFPASFEIMDINPSPNYPCIVGQEEVEGIKFTLAGICENKILASKSIEEYKYTVYVLKMHLQNSSQSKYFQLSKSYAIVNFIYGRPNLFNNIFFISLFFIFLVTCLSYPLKDKEKIKNYLLQIGSVWTAQEGVSFLQGHRPLELTLYDLTIISPLILI